MEMVGNGLEGLTERVMSTRLDGKKPWRGPSPYKGPNLKGPPF